MLKIKDNVDIKTLEDFGFKPKYDEDTGDVKAYEKITKETEYMGVTIKIENIKSQIRIFKQCTKRIAVWKINPYKEHLDQDTLYDLIQAGLVEKI